MCQHVKNISENSNAYLSHDEEHVSDYLTDKGNK